MVNLYDMEMFEQALGKIKTFEDSNPEAARVYVIEAYRLVAVIRKQSKRLAHIYEGRLHLLLWESPIGLTSDKDNVNV